MDNWVELRCTFRWSRKNSSASDVQRLSLHVVHPIPDRELTMGCSYLRRLGRGQRSCAGVDSTWPRTQEGLDKLPCRLTSLDTHLSWPGPDKWVSRDVNLQGSLSRPS